jgi:predicted phosphoadenosine phosphosulfate sulfurtransferase
MKSRILEYIEDWSNKGYAEGLPDKAPKRLEVLNKVPSYRRIAFSILNNDHSLQGLGFTPKKSRYYHLIKQEELKLRNKNKEL